MNLSDEDLGFVLKGKGTKLADGNKDREEAIHELADLLANDERVIVKKGSLISNGRASFGRENEGRDGIALFLPDGQTDD